MDDAHNESRKYVVVEAAPGAPSTFLLPREGVVTCVHRRDIRHRGEPDNHEDEYKWSLFELADGRAVVCEVRSTWEYDNDGPTERTPHQTRAWLAPGAVLELPDELALSSDYELYWFLSGWIDPFFSTLREGWTQPGMTEFVSHEETNGDFLTERLRLTRAEEWDSQINACRGWLERMPGQPGLGVTGDVWLHTWSSDRYGVDYDTLRFEVPVEAGRSLVVLFELELAGGHLTASLLDRSDGARPTARPPLATWNTSIESTDLANGGLVGSRNPAPIPAVERIEIAAFESRLRAHDWHVDASADPEKVRDGEAAEKLLFMYSRQSSAHEDLWTRWSHGRGDPRASRASPEGRRPATSPVSTPRTAKVIAGSEKSSKAARSKTRRGAAGRKAPGRPKTAGPRRRR